MAFEKGVVIKMGAGGPETAWVKTIQPSACKACASRKSCSAEASKEREVEAINRAGAQVGDIIQIYMDTTALLKAAFLLYVFPIVCMLAGGVTGNMLSGQLRLDTSLLSVVFALGCLIVSMVLFRIRAGRMALRIEYRPKITRIIGHQTDATQQIEPLGDCPSNVASSI